MKEHQQYLRVEVSRIISKFFPQIYTRIPDSRVPVSVKLLNEIN